jgi:exosortase D (VPLPA-CTERM-specific)
MLGEKVIKRESSVFLQISAGILLAGGLLYLYWPVLSRLILSLADSEDYSYGLLLPLVSGYIVYLKLPRLRAGWRPSWAGLLVMALGLFLFVVGELAAELYTTRFSFVVVLAGLVLLAGGWGLLRLLAFPLILLVLMLPLPELITNKLTLPLQLVSSTLAGWFLNFLGVPVFRQGNIIDLGTRQLQIVKACSGLRYILPLLAFGALFCYFYQRRLWKVAVLLVSLIPLAIFANALRVAAMGLYPSLVEGFWHGFSGWLIFLFCLGALALINQLLNYLWPLPAGSLPPPAGPAEKIGSRQSAISNEVDVSPAIPILTLPSGEPQSIKVTPYLLSALALVLLAIPLMHRAAMAPPVPLKQSFEDFPLQVGPWQGRFTPVDPEMVKLTQSHAHLSADFTNPEQGPVSVWIAYYETQKKAGGFVHSPKGCLIASGWRFLDSGFYEIGPGRRVNYLLAEQMGTRLVVFYWYMQRGRWLTSEYWNKFYMGYDGLLKRRTDGAMVRLIAPAGDDVPGAQKRLAEFARMLAPVLQNYIPD